MRFKDDNDNRYRVNFTRATEAHIDKMTVAEFIEYLENNAEREDESTPIYIDGKTIWCKDYVLRETYKLCKEFLVSEDGSRLFYSISVIKRAELVDDSTEAAADNEREENKDMSTYTQFEKRLKEDIKAVKRVRKVIGDDCITREAYTKYDALHMLACDLALCNSIDELKKQVRADSNDLPNDVYKQMQQYIEQNVKEIEETEEPAKPWEEQERTVTLTNELCSMLQCYILMTTNHRKDEIKAWEELAQEKDENGAPKFKNAASNAQFWRDMEIQLQQIYTAAD
jgi:hypothetical protein|nr:MAG TPA: hypothetical protein [Caudoviricetes sp.]